MHGAILDRDAPRTIIVRLRCENVAAGWFSRGRKPPTRWRFRGCCRPEAPRFPAAVLHRLCQPCSDDIERVDSARRRVGQNAGFAILFMERDKQLSNESYFPFRIDELLAAVARKIAEQLRIRAQSSLNVTGVRRASAVDSKR